MGRDDVSQNSKYSHVKLPLGRQNKEEDFLLLRQLQNISTLEREPSNVTVYKAPFVPAAHIS